jgi:DNA-binding transcriptional LysR family regulator
MPRRRITFRQLDTFAAVARHGSFTKAAEALHLTQPAVSLQVRQIVDSVGLPLFAQEGREVALTQAGEEMLNTVRLLDDVWSRFESVIDDLKGLQRGRLRVALVSTARYFLPRMLGNFCRRFPEIDIAMEITDRDRLVARMRGNQDDLYIMLYPPEELEVVSYPFLDNELVVIAALGHRAAGQSLELAALAGERFILREVGSGSRRTIDTHLQAIGLKLDVKLTLNSNEAICDLVASGMGPAVLSRHALPADPASGGLCILDVAGFPLRKPWRAVHLKSKILSLPARAFLDHLLQANHCRLERQASQ